LIIPEFIIYIILPKLNRLVIIEAEGAEPGMCIRWIEESLRFLPLPLLFPISFSPHPVTYKSSPPPLKPAIVGLGSVVSSHSGVWGGSRLKINLAHSKPVTKVFLDILSTMLYVFDEKLEIL